MRSHVSVFVFVAVLALGREHNPVIASCGNGQCRGAVVAILIKRVQTSVRALELRTLARFAIYGPKPSWRPRIVLSGSPTRRHLAVAKGVAAAFLKNYGG